MPTKLTSNIENALGVSEVYLENANRRMISADTSRNCIFAIDRGNVEGFYGLADFAARKKRPKIRLPISYSVRQKNSVIARKQRTYEQKYRNAR